MPFVFGKLKPKITLNLKQRLEPGSPVFQVHTPSPNCSPCFEHRSHSRFENVKTNDFMIALSFFWYSAQDPFRDHGKKQHVWFIWCILDFCLEQDELCPRIACFSPLAITAPWSQQLRCRYPDQSNSGCLFSPRYSNANTLLKDIYADQNCGPELFPTKWISIMFSSGDWPGLYEIY